VESCGRFCVDGPERKRMFASRQSLATTGSAAVGFSRTCSMRTVLTSGRAAAGAAAAGFMIELPCRGILAILAELLLPALGGRRPRPGHRQPQQPASLD
jgi:hypothetical protein